MIKLIRVFILLFISISIIVVLYTYSSKKINIKTGFDRSFSSQKAFLLRQFFLESEPYSIAEITSGYIILYKSKKPYNLLKIDTNLHETENYNLPFPASAEKIRGINSIAIYNSETFLLNGSTSSVYKMNADNKTINVNKLNALPFYQADVINSNRFLFMSKKKYQGINRRIVKKVNWQGQELKYYMPEKQVDGYFCSDGQFNYDKTSNRLVYMFYYRGEFTCLDTNMKIIYKAKTIDTVKHTNIQITKKKTIINDSITFQKITPTKPPSIVNRRICVANDNIYIQSYLKAENEESNEFNHSYVIDVYDLKNGNYRFSFYLPKIERKKLKQFKVDKDILVALYDKMAVVFKVPT